VVVKQQELLSTISIVVIENIDESLYSSNNDEKCSLLFFALGWLWHMSIDGMR
jgi:hypothetical protein